MSAFGHKHDHEPVAVQHTNAGPFTPKGTIVLWRCKCGNLTTRQLAGNLTTQQLAGEWTFSQVRGERELTAQERIETGLLLSAGIPGGPS
jgi:hypothetical protein